MVDNIDFNIVNPYLIVEAYEPLYIPKYRLERCHSRLRCSYCGRNAIIKMVSVEYDDSDVKCCIRCLKSWILECDILIVN